MLGRKKKLKVRFEWDSSDDEFALPLSKRIAQSKSGKSRAKPLLREKSDNKPINRTGSKKKNVTRKRKMSQEMSFLKKKQSGLRMMHLVSLAQISRTLVT